MHRTLSWLLTITGTLTFGLATQAAIPVWLDTRFDIPPGFHIYRAAGSALSGGSYALTFDGAGRLLVGDGTSVRRLIDEDGDGTFDRYETVATGLGPRGPQGLLVYGDALYAVGGDGLQRFEGYRAGGLLTNRTRLGQPLRTGGDHDTHTVLRGQDGYLYLMAGNGAGLTNREHITENSSPALAEREASVFRISPDGSRWECLGSGGRNPPSLGMNRLGDLFSFDSDMEWHVDLPWYRPVRLNHWALGADQGWEEVGAHPPYAIDTVPGLLDLGRGSPNWGVFYEHTQLPARYQDSFVVCDYRWKGAASGDYDTTGRLVAFFLRRQGAGWAATAETLAKPRPGARDSEERAIQFAVVDVAVGPDGSLFVTDHNQGIWRICHDPNLTGASPAPALLPAWPAAATAAAPRLQALLTLPQPAAERSRLREVALRKELGSEQETDILLQAAALDAARPLVERLRAIQLLAPGYAALPAGFLAKLQAEATDELRGQAAWLLGLRGGEADVRGLIALAADAEPFVRRRALEGLTRCGRSATVLPALLERMKDPERLVRHEAMVALAHQPTGEWFEAAAAKPERQIRLRALAASQLRHEPPGPEALQRTLGPLLAETAPAREDQLDLLRVLDLFRPQAGEIPALKAGIESHLTRGFPGSDRDVRWEKIRLLGEYRVGSAFPVLLRELEVEKDPVTQFHLAQALSALTNGWSLEEEQRAVSWFLGTQKGWFAEVSSKGRQFPEFWMTVLSSFAERHQDALMLEAGHIDLATPLGGVFLGLVAQASATGEELISLFEKSEKPPVRLRILGAMRGMNSPAIGRFLEEEHDQLDPETEEGAALSGLILEHWANHFDDSTLPFLIYEGLFHDNIQVVRTVVASMVQNSVRVRTQLANDAASAAAIVDPPPKRTPTSSVPLAPKVIKKSDAPLADLAGEILTRMIDRPELANAMENVLVIWSRQTRPGFKVGASLGGTPDEASRQAASVYWKAWFSKQFNRPFEPITDSSGQQRTDDEIHRFIVGNDSTGGNGRRGASVYETLQCHSCHGGGVRPGNEGRLFGPDLVGVTRRLSRVELADSLVYPSRQVADRFKAAEITLKDGASYTGFVTEQNTEAVTLADRDQVRRFPRGEIQSVAPQAASLMPERLLNRLSPQEIKDLLAFLENGAK